MKTILIIAFSITCYTGFSQEKSPYFTEVDSNVQYVLNSISFDSVDFPVVTLNFASSKKAFLKYINTNSDILQAGILYKNKSSLFTFYVEEFKSTKLLHVQERNKNNDAWPLTYTIQENPNYLIYIGGRRCCSFHSLVFYERTEKKVELVARYFNHFRFAGQSYLFDNRYKLLNEMMFSNEGKFQGFETGIPTLMKEELNAKVQSIRGELLENSVQISLDSLNKIFHGCELFDSTVVTSIFMTTWNDNCAFKIKGLNIDALLIKGKYFHVLLDESNDSKKEIEYQLFGGNYSKMKLEHFATWDGDFIYGSDNKSDNFQVCYFDEFVDQLLSGTLWFPWSLFNYGTEAISDDIQLR